MSEELSREQLINKVHEEWMPAFRKKFFTVLEQDIDKRISNVRQIIKQADEGDETKAIHAFAERVLEQVPDTTPKEKEKGEDETSPEKPPYWHEFVEEVAAPVPGQLRLPQQEIRFTPKKEDGLKLRLQKRGKLLLRTLGKKHWSREVPLKLMVKEHLLGIADYAQQWYTDVARINIEMLLRVYASSNTLSMIKTEQKSGEEKDDLFKKYENPKSLSEILEDGIERFQQYKEKAEKELEQWCSEREQALITDMDIAGTVEQKAKFTKVKLHRVQKEQARLYRKTKAEWDNIQTVLANQVLLSGTFLTLKRQAEERMEGFRTSVQEFFEQYVLNPLTKVEEQLEEAIEIFGASEDRKSADIKKISAEHGEAIADYIDHNLLKSLREVIEDAVLSTRLDRFTSALPEWSSNQPEKATFVTELNFELKPPQYDFEEVPWQILVQRVLNNQIATPLQPKQIKPEDFLQEIATEIEGLSRIIFTNLELTEEVSKADEEQPFEVAKEGLQRSAKQLEELEERVRDKRDAITGLLQERRQAAFGKLARLLCEQDVGDFRLAGAEYKARETATDWKTKGQVWWAILEERLELFGRFAWRKIKYFATRVRTFLGFEEKEPVESAKTDLATFLSETDAKIESLPFIYRRLFDFKKEVDDRFYIRKPEQFARLKKGYELWQDGFPSTFAVVGEKGSGKSLFLRLLEKEILDDHQKIEINFQDTVWKPEDVLPQISRALKLDEELGVEELAEAIQRKRKRVIIFLENIQNCYIRSLDGFDALEQMMFLISETSKNILWVVSSTRYGWKYLGNVLSITDYFTHIAQTDELTEAQIKELVLKRHHASGYQLRFLPAEKTQKNRAYRKLMDDEQKQQEYLQNEFFEKLAKLAEGNASTAMIYWIRSIDEFDDAYFYIKPFEFGSVNRVGELNAEELFALAAFVQHDALTATELQKIMHQPLRESQLMISRLASRSILNYTNHGYMLNHLIYRQVVRVLKEANIIH